MGLYLIYLRVSLVDVAGGYFLGCVHGGSRVVASLIVEHRLRAHGFNNGGTWVCSRGTWT